VTRKPEIFPTPEALQEPVIGAFALFVTICRIRVVVAAVAVLPDRELHRDEPPETGIAQEVGPLHVGVAVVPSLARERDLQRGPSSYGEQVAEQRLDVTLARVDEIGPPVGDPHAAPA